MRLGTQNTKEQLTTELVKKAQRECKCPVFCTGLALLISIPSKIKIISVALQREGIDTQQYGVYRALVRSEELRVARQAKQRPGANCVWPERSV